MTSREPRGLEAVSHAEGYCTNSHSSEPQSLSPSTIRSRQRTAAAARGYCFKS